MSDELVLIDREALLAELQHAFDEKTAEVLLGVLDKVAAQVRASGVTREDFRELRQIVGELAEAQRHTDERVGRLEAAVEELIQAQQRTEEQVKELAEAQRRTEEQVKELAEAQRHTEERVGRLEVAVEELSRAVGELTEGMDQLRKQVGGLSDTVGGDIEDIAYIVLHDVLKREFGWKVGMLERTWQTWGEKPEEVNIFGVATDPARPEKTIWIVGEAKHNLTFKEVERFVRQVGRARRHLVGEIFPVCFCYRVRPEVQQQVLDAGIRLCFSYGKLV